MTGHLRRGDGIAYARSILVDEPSIKSLLSAADVAVCHLPEGEMRREIVQTLKDARASGITAWVGAKIQVPHAALFNHEVGRESIRAAREALSAYGSPGLGRPRIYDIAERLAAQLEALIRILEGNTEVLDHAQDHRHSDTAAKLDGENRRLAAERDAYREMVVDLVGRACDLLKNGPQPLRGDTKR